MAITFGHKINSGGFGDIWSATDSLDRKVAVKIIRSAAAGMSNAIDHAKALARTNHTNVVTIYGVEKVNDPEGDTEVDGILMELLEGDTLAQRLRGPTFTVDELRQIGTGAIDGLEHIHQQGLTHGDLHNENVMVHGTHVKLIDILYLDSLAALTTESREEKLRRDLVKLRLILHDLLSFSKLDSSVVTEFTRQLRCSDDIASIREVFSKITSNESVKARRGFVELLDSGRFLTVADELAETMVANVRAGMPWFLDPIPDLAFQLEMARGANVSLPKPKPEKRMQPEDWPAFYVGLVSASGVTTQVTYDYLGPECAKVIAEQACSHFANVKAADSFALVWLHSHPITRMRYHCVLALGRREGEDGRTVLSPLDSGRPPSIETALNVLNSWIRTTKREPRR